MRPTPLRGPDSRVVRPPGRPEPTDIEVQLMTKRLIAILALAAALAACTPGASPSPTVQSPAGQESPGGLQSPAGSGLESPAGSGLESGGMESASPSAS